MLRHLHALRALPLCLLMFVCALLRAQDEEDTPQPVPPLPQIPETTVIGQPEAFPANPLGEDTLLSPSLTEVRAGEVGSSVTAISEEQIERSEQSTVLEVLRGVPGLDVTQSGGPGGTTSVFLRGAPSEHTKVLLDGIPLNDPITPGRSFDFSTLSVDNIERIEVLRGPQSTLYGSDAMGGVINIITKRGEGPPETRLGVMGGSFGTRQYSGRYSGGNDFGYYSAGGSFLGIDGFSAANEDRPGNVEGDDFYLGTFSSRVGWTPSDLFDVDFVVRYQRALADIDDNGGDFQDDPNENNFTEQLFGRLQFRYENPARWWEQRLIFNLADHTRRTDDPTDFLHPLDSFFSAFNSRYRSVEWRNSFLFTEGNVLTVGAVDGQEIGDSSFFGTFFGFPFDGQQIERRLSNTGIYFEDRFQVGERWFGSIGARQDHYSQAGTADTYRLTSLYRAPGTETAFKGSIGTGFKAPTIFQLFDPTFGNPALAPEEIKGWDVGAEQPLWGGRMLVGATYFRNDFENLIDFATVGFFNVNRARSSGVEVFATWDINELTSLLASYTFTETRDLETGIPLLRRPEDKASLTLYRDLCCRGTISATLLYVGERADRDFTQFPSPLVLLDDYIVVNVAGSVPLTERIEWFARVDNLFDEQYEEVFGFGTADISGYSGVRVVW